MAQHKTKKELDKDLDKELKDTFPASDPPSGNIFTGAGSPKGHKSVKSLSKAANKR